MAIALKKVDFNINSQKVWRRFCELKTKPCKGFKSKKWLRHFLLWYKLCTMPSAIKVGEMLVNYEDIADTSHKFISEGLDQS